MAVKFAASTIDNDAIFVVIDLLLPYLKYDPDSEYRVLNDSDISEKYKILYEQVFLPYVKESEAHFRYHHRADYAPNGWKGEQSCLSMIHAINQRAWWFLYFFAIKETIKEHWKASEEDLNNISRRTTCYILDGDCSIEDAVSECISQELNLDEATGVLIANEITQMIEGYKEKKSQPMTYR